MGKTFLRKFGISDLKSGVTTYNDFFDFIKQECEKRLWDARTFDLLYVDQSHDTDLTLECSLGSYRHYIQLYEAIEQEIYYNYLFSESKVAQIVDKVDFILRDNLIDFQEIDDYRGRPAKLGLNIFTIIADPDGGHSTMLHKRHSKVAEQPNFYHTVPAGTFQPHSEHSIDTQFSIEYSVFREFFEEILGVEEAEKRASKSGLYDGFDKEVPTGTGDTISIGDRLFNDLDGEVPPETGAYQLIPTGIITDILSFKPDITFILYIKDEELHDPIFYNAMSHWEGQLGRYSISGNAHADES